VIGEGGLLQGWSLAEILVVDHLLFYFSGHVFLLF
jgi:hypothetical protein